MTGCTLCDLDLPADPVTDPDVDGEFCCRGCLAVARSLDDADLDAASPEELLDPGDDDADGEVCYLSVDGMHCATCELFLESTATDHAGVEGASASYATDTMKLVYDPGRVDAGDLPDVVSTAGYEARERGVEDDHEPDSPTATFLVGGGFFGMMTMLWYVLFIYPQHFGFAPVVEFGSFGRLYLLAQIWLFTSVVLFYSGFPLLRGAYVSLRAGQPNMDLLVSLAATSAYVYSTAVMLTGGIDVYFDVTVAIVLVVSAGNYYEDRVKRSAVSLLSDLTAASVEEARLRDGRTLPVEDVAPGSELLVRPGERVPLDGTVVEGVAAVDEALVTGESLPVTKREGDDVVGGSVVTDTPLVVAVSEDATSTLDRIVGLLWEVQSARPGVQRLADRLATVFVPTVTALALLVAAGTLVLGGTATGALLVGLTVLVVACPCALGLATPLAVAAGIQRAAESGVVVASETIFEVLPDVDVVALDKTGTLTSGEMTVTGVDADDGEHLLARAAALERYSNHPVADAVVAFAAGEGLRPAPENPATDGGGPAEATGRNREADDWDDPASSVEGRPTGVVGTVDGEETVVGNRDLFESEGLAVPERFEERADTIAGDGGVPVLVGWNGRCRGVLAVTDRPRDDWDETVTALADDGRSVVVLTGDDGAAADRFRDHPAVDEVFAGVPPDGKVATVQRLRAQGTVAMVGDGDNDAPALAAADVGVAIAGSGGLAAEAADAVVTDGRLDAVPVLFDVATATRRRVRENLTWAFGYNAVAIPLAATGLLNPLFAALAMGSSSALVVLNSARSLVPRE
ncbi:heavy metal translocating P-type ATPase [Haloarchaeobius litoreus]|uniref:Heavy metal translocating P-type ATPase n=1 Tax=Haloarchaeobius litoreus TaxID=755306 RepID=A0ABD6DEC0_9EURY|nr:heavy metal translocating P-type ATPase [Haloarchaeobius litoreus]